MALHQYMLFKTVCIACCSLDDWHLQQAKALLACALMSYPGAAVLQPNQQLPEDFSQQVFGSLYDQPLCSLYVPSTTEGFSGVCEALETQCSDNSTWCHGGSNPDSQGVEELMALQLTKVHTVAPELTVCSDLA